MIVGLLILGSNLVGGGCASGLLHAGEHDLSSESNSSEEVFHPSIVEAISEIEARSPKDYPKVITPLPEPGGFEGKSIDDLIEMAQSWNPAMRVEACKRLALEGDEIMPRLEKMMTSKLSIERKAAVSAAKMILEHQLRNATHYFPQSNSRQAQPKVREKFNGLIPLLITLCGDEDRETVSMTVEMLGMLLARTKEVSEALLSLFGHDDEHLAQWAVHTIHKYIGVEGVDQETLFRSFEAGMKQPLPGGKGKIILLILQQDEAFQKRCSSFALGLLEWTPDRDTMGGATGQVESLKLLAKHDGKALLSVVPLMMKKIHRHQPIYFEATVETSSSLGEEARSLLPLFEETLAGIQKELKAIEKEGINRKNRLRHEQLKSREEALLKGIDNVGQ